MQRSLRVLTLSALVALVTVPASATAGTYNFSYTFAFDGFTHVMSGQLSGNRSDNGTAGDASDDYLILPTVLSAAYDGVAMISSPLQQAYYDASMPAGFVSAPTHIYFAAISNNFIISQCITYACFIDAYNDANVQIDYFMMRATSQGGTGVQYYSEVNNFQMRDTYSDQGVWVLSEATSGGGSRVPEPGSAALLAIGLAGLAGVGALTRRQPKA